MEPEGLAAWASENNRQIDDHMAESMERFAQELGLPGFSGLTVGDIDAMLARSAGLFKPDVAPLVVGTMHDLIAYHHDTGGFTDRDASALRGKLDSAAKAYLATAHAERRLFDDPFSAKFGEEFDKLAYADHVDEVLDDESPIRDLLDLPDRLPPLRLPGTEVLAAAARQSPLLAQARALAEWVGERKAVDDLGELGADDARAAAAALGLSLPGEVRYMSDLPELMLLWQLAVEVMFLDLDGEAARTDDGLDNWPDAVANRVLETWEQALDFILGRTLALEAELAGESSLNFEGAAGTYVPLFLARDEGIPLKDIRDLLQALATSELEHDDLDAAWTAWTQAHGDPVTVLYGRLAEHGAVVIEDDVVRLTELGTAAMRNVLREEGVDIPLLGPPETMSAADLVAFGDGASENEFHAEVEAWRAHRSDEQAAEQLLAAAADSGPAERMLSFAALETIGTAAEPSLRAALDTPSVSPYAKTLLAKLLGEQPEFEPSLDDLAWLLMDALAGPMEDFDEEELPEYVASSVPPGEVAIFERMWQLEHPHAHEALALIGSYHPDRKTAKAARKAAFKVPR